MRAIRIALPQIYVFGLVLGCVAVSGGCGGDEPTTVMKPAAPVTESSKDSMDYYKAEMAKKGAKKR